ncbi:aquaporin AQPAe.a-like [Lucilia cuprina]|uniref:aquaporin AQPAe.a-like n=1 Tax=Lucilia cuprina TaxID=7375 RepID=UPI001F06813A|nr:aquaporin AQPAe.a-like [Lucilia cuprina]
MSVRLLIKLFFSEFIATGFLMFAACMGAWESTIFPNTNFQISINIALIVMIVVQCFGHVSGGHVNPTVTVAAFINGVISFPMLVVYVLGQVLGGTVGFGILKAVSPPMPENFCLTLPNPELTTLQVFVVEFVISSMLTVVVCSLWDSSNAGRHDALPIRVGFTLGSLVFSASRLSGGSMNPARSFAPALLMSNFDYQWLYWVSPLSSAIITSIIYKYFFKTPEPKEIKSNNTIEEDQNKVQV